jgi:hypothetical protein
MGLLVFAICGLFLIVSLTFFSVIPNTFKVLGRWFPIAFPPIMLPQARNADGTIGRAFFHVCMRRASGAII